MRVPAVLKGVAVDTSALRDSRDLRALVLGTFVTGLGTQATLVALPYQLYVVTHSAFLVGLLGAVELGPLITMALFGGAIADRMDRRRLLLLNQVALVVFTGALAALSAAGDPPVVALYVLGGILAGFTSVQNVVRSSMVPQLVAPAKLRSALALTFGLSSLTLVIGPGLGGILIGVVGVAAVYAIDAASCLAMVAAVWVMGPQPPQRDTASLEDDAPRILASIGEGLRFVRGQPALMGSFAIDLVAMAFGMPRALFAVLSLSVYHAGAEGTGLMYAAVAAGSTVAALTTGWLADARWLGRIVIGAVLVWGGAIACVGLVSSIWPAAVLLAVAGAADSVSAVCRGTINQVVTPDAMRGRMSSVFSLVVTSGPRVGDVESGAAAALAGARVSVGSGGLLCMAGVGLIMLAFPALYAYDGAALEPAAT